MYRLYSAHLVPSEGALEGAQVRGRLEGGGDALPRPPGSVAGTPGPIGAVAARWIRNSARGGPSRRVPMRQPRITRGPSDAAPYRGTDRQVLLGPDSGGQALHPNEKGDGA